MTNENVKCGECKKELARDDSWYWAIGDIAICEECQVENYMVCGNCSFLVHISEATIDDNSAYCEACFEDIK